MFALLIGYLPMLIFNPLFASIGLHIGDGIFLVDNFCAQHGLDDVFHRYNAAQTAIFVDDYGNVLFLFQ